MTLVPLPVSAAVPAAKAFALYLDRLKKEGKRTDNRIPLPDFLIGARAGGRAKARHSRPGPGADLLPKGRLGGALEQPPGQFGPALQVLASSHYWHFWMRQISPVWQRETPKAGRPCHTGAAEAMETPGAKPEVGIARCWPLRLRAYRARWEWRIRGPSATSWTGATAGSQAAGWPRRCSRPELRRRLGA